MLVPMDSVEDSPDVHEYLQNIMRFGLPICCRAGQETATVFDHT